jgi:hypothetical protein
MFYILYQITNVLTGKIYIGVHKTCNLNDGYMGSGKLIRRAIEKHGADNFTKDILEQFDNSAAMYAREKEVVTEEFLSRPDVYNLRCGGFGGFEYLNDGSAQHIARCKLGYAASLAKINFVENGTSCAARMRAENRGIFSKEFVHAWKRNKSLQQLGNCPAAREKARVTQRATFALTGHQQGEKNSQYGTCWVVHEVFGNKKIKKDLLPDYLLQGWVKGRILP